MKRFLAFRSIRRKILAGTVFILSITVLIAGILSFFQLRNQEHERARYRLSSIETEIDRFLGRQRQTLGVKAKMISVLPIMRAVLDSGDKATIADTIQSYSDDLHIDHVELFDLNGKPLAETGVNSPSLSSYAAKVLQSNPDSLDALGGIYLAEDGPFLLSASPVGVGDHINGFLLVANRIDKKTASTIGSLTGAQVSFFPAEKGTPTTQDGLTQSGAFSTVSPDKGLGYRLSLDNGTSLEQFRGFLFLLIGVALLILLIAVIYATFFARLVSTPIVQLNEFTKSMIARGGAISNERLKKPSNDEIGELTDSVNHFLDEIQKYNAELEEKVRQRTADLSALLNNLGQGFFTIDSQGVIQPGSTKITHEIFGREPSGLTIIDALGVSDAAKAHITKWIQLSFTNPAGVELADLLAFGPREYISSTARQYSLEYRPILTDDGKLYRLICILTDVTERRKLELLSLRQAETVQRITGILSAPWVYTRFSQDLDRVSAGLEAEVDKNGGLREFAHHLHTIKGLASTVHLAEAKDFASEWENKALEGKDDFDRGGFKQAVQELRRAVARFKDELSRFTGQSAAEEVRSFPIDELKTFYGKITAELGSQALLAETFRNHFLLTDLREILESMQEVVRYSAGRSGKKILYTVQGESIPVDGKSYQWLPDVFTHLIRNAVDHGIEEGELRKKAGKPSDGKVTVTCRKREKSIELKISDDGQGIDPKVVRNAAVKKGVAPADEIESLSDDDAVKLIFAHGFSTRDDLTEISGRGIGLGFVKEFVEKIGGTVTVASHVGRGSEFTITVPRVTI